MSRDGGGRTTAAVKLLADAGVPAQGILGDGSAGEAELPREDLDRVCCLRDSQRA